MSQIPTILHLVGSLGPKKVLDIGKGFGKYGFLIHEYIGIDQKARIDPSLRLWEQSRITIDAVEIDEDLLLPHLDHIYRKVYTGSILDTYKAFEEYDLVLMVDIIEHLPKQEALEVVKFFMSRKISLIIATPRDFFEQHLYESEYENHVSHWTAADFSSLGQLDYQRIDAGMIYLLTPTKSDVSGFGQSFLKKLKKIRRVLINEFL